ncbi:hypothetical protein [Azospirillum sp. sgz302134]
MVTKRRSARGWLLKGIDPEGALVRHVEEVAAKDGITVEAWVEHWLGLVLQHHYSVQADGARAPTAAEQAEILKADVRRNLKALEDNLSRIYQTVERTHQGIERVEGVVNTTEERVHSREEGASRRSKDR